MTDEKVYLLLADDDIDDCLFFREAMEELPVHASLTTVNDGVQLIQYLKKNPHPFPSILYLDLNMPRKNGFECLAEIKSNDNLKNLPVIIYSTSFDPDIADRLYENGAHFYIRKPPEFPDLKKVILNQSTSLQTAKKASPQKKNFSLQLNRKHKRFIYGKKDRSFAQNPNWYRRFG
jgi:CheY-like chemotaxis protein